MSTGEILKAALAARRENLGMDECRRIFAEAGIPLNASSFARTREEALAAGDRIGYPVVLKIVSPEIVHKTEVGGVRLQIRSREELGAAWDEMMRAVSARVPGARVDGVTVDEQVSGTELIVGSTRDPQFGPLIMFGLGGILVEIYRDVTFRLIPIERADALEMIEEVRGKQIYRGARGLPRADPDSLVEVLLAVSRLVERYPAIRELDLNPLVVTAKGLRAIDARILLSVDR